MFSSQSAKIKYSFNKIREVKSYRVGELFSAYRDILWDDGRHKYNVSSFIGEIDEILLGERFSAFDQSTLDNLIGTLRQRGNSNATINRKMAALSKLLRKAHKMEISTACPSSAARRSGRGRIRFLEKDEEARLFVAIRSRSEDAYRLSVFLVDTGCRLGEAWVSTLCKTRDCACVTAGPDKPAAAPWCRWPRLFLRCAIRPPMDSPPRIGDKRTTIPPCSLVGPVTKGNASR